MLALVILRRALRIQIVSDDNVCVCSDSRSSSQEVSVVTVRGEYDLMCPDAEDLAALVDTNLSGLKERSVYAVALLDASKQTGM